MSIFTGPHVRGRWIGLALGMLLPLAFAPFDWFWLAPVTLGGLFLTWAGQTPREAAWRGFCFGLGSFGAGTYWLFISLHLLGGAPLPIVIAMMTSLVVATAMYLALCGWFTVRFFPSDGVLRWLLAAPAAWTFIEWTRSWLFTGFPWLSIGYSQVGQPLSAWAPIGGVHTVTWLVVLIAALVPWAVRGSMTNRVVAVGVLTLIVSVSIPLKNYRWTTPGPKDMKIALIQGAIPQVLKWLPSQRLPTLQTYGRMSLDIQHQDLIIWPEVAIPAVPEQVQPFLDGMSERMAERDTQLFAGILTFDEDLQQYSNTLLSLGDPPGQYQKRHLVPFGEYFPVPDFLRELMRLMNMPYETTTAGRRDQVPLMVGDVAVAPSICYEVAFGTEQLDFLPAAQFLVNVSNDAWFGDSIAPHQHLQMARMRALEAGRYMLRATNTGITAVVSPDGEIQARIPQFVPGVLTATARPYSGATPYVRTGNWLVVSAMVLVLLLAGWRVRSTHP